MPIREEPVQRRLLCTGIDLFLRSFCLESGTPWPHNLCEVAASTTSRSRRFLFKDKFRLLADAQLADDIAVAVRVMCFQVVQQAAALADEHQKAAPGSVILLMCFEMLGQLANAHTQNCNLNFRRTGVGIMSAEALNQVGFCYGCKHSVLVTPQIVESDRQTSDRQLNLNVFTKSTTNCA